MDIGTTIALAKSAADAFKAIRDAVGKKPEAVNAELTKLNAIIFEMQEQLRQAHAEITDLTTQLHEAKRLLQFNDELQFRSETGVFWKGEWPYCPNCWEANRKPVRLQEMANGIWSCPVEKASFSLDYRKEPKPWESRGHRGQRVRY
jgi:hypothetical protein